VRLRESFCFSRKYANKRIKVEFIALVFEPLEVNLHDLMMSSTVKLDEGALKPRGLSLNFIKVIAW
jgi:hypothetical protein